MRLLLPLFIILTLFPTQDASASGAIQAKQRAIQQRQQQMQQQAIAQQQQAVAAQQQAYSQAVTQRQQSLQQAQQISQQQALQQRAYNQAITQQAANAGNNQRAAYNQAQQAVSQFQPPQQRYQQQMAQDGVLMSGQNQPNQQMYQQPNIPGVAQPMYGDLFYTPPVEEVVNITDIWKKMENNSHSWALMIDMEPKILTVQRMIDHFKNQGATIKKDPSHYAQMIDSMAFQNPQLLDQPFENIMRVISIIEYDFSNGQNKDQLARQIFPDDKHFKANKQRLGF